MKHPLGKDGLPQWLSGKEFACCAGGAGDMGLIPGSARCSGGGQGNPLEYSCLKNPMDRGAWWATVHSVEKSRRRLKQLSTHTLSERQKNKDYVKEQKTLGKKNYNKVLHCCYLFTKLY